MSNRIFPQLPGLGWPVNRSPYFSTTVSVAKSGQEVRLPNYPFELEQFELPINHEHQKYPADFQKLLAFFVASDGAFDSWLYQDPTDNYTVNNSIYEGLNLPTGAGQNVIGTGDGVTLAFQLTRAIGGVSRPIFDINGITATLAPPITSPYVNVFVSGSPVLSGFTVSATGMLTFVSAPASLAPIAADFSFFKRCRFNEDNLEFSNFLQYIFKTGKVKMRQVFK